MFSSGVVRGLWFELTAVTFVAMFVWLSNKVPHHPLFSPFSTCTGLPAVSVLIAAPVEAPL